MKTIHTYLLLIAVLVGFLTISANAQVTNLMVNDSTTHFTVTSGDLLGWSYNLPALGTADAEIWIDANQNGTIDEGTDVLLFNFQQVDNNPSGDGGPPDIDTIAGQITFMAPIGLPPQHYVMRFTNNSIGGTVPGIILAIENPVYTISGHITPPDGNSSHYIPVQAKCDSGDALVIFWEGLTDENGNYVIQMGNETAGTLWNVRVDRQFSGYNPRPEQYSFTLTGNETDYNFSFTVQTSVRNNSTSTPQKYTLGQNYPNPFNPATEISFQLAEQGFVTLKIYNVLGAEVTTLISQEMNAGRFSATWNAGHNPSGIYFYRIQTKNFTATKKMLLMK